MLVGSMEEKRQAREKYYNDPIVKKCYELGLFKNIIETDEYTFCNFGNLYYLYNYYGVGTNDWQIGIIFNSSILKYIKKDPKIIHAFLQNNPNYIVRNTTYLNEEWLKANLTRMEALKSFPHTDVDLELEEEIIKKYNTDS